MIFYESSMRVFWRWLNNIFEMHKIEILYSKVSYILNANRRMLSNHADNPITKPMKKRKRRCCGISESLILVLLMSINLSKQFLLKHIMSIVIFSVLRETYSVSIITIQCADLHRVLLCRNTSCSCFKRISKTIYWYIYAYLFNHICAILFQNVNHTILQEPWDVYRWWTALRRFETFYCELNVFCRDRNNL